MSNTIPGNDDCGDGNKGCGWDAKLADWYAANYGEYATNRLAVDALNKMGLFRTVNSDESMVIVDVGCGTGAALRRAVAAGYVETTRTRLIGVDPVPRMVEIAKERASKESRFSALEYLVGSAEHVPLENEIANVVFAFDSFDHWQNQLMGFAEIHRILKKQGALVIVKDKSVFAHSSEEKDFCESMKKTLTESTKFEIYSEECITEQGSDEAVSFVMWVCSRRP